MIKLERFRAKFNDHTVFEIRLSDEVVAQLPEGTLSDFADQLQVLMDGYFGEYK